MYTVYYGEVPVHDAALGIFALEASIEYSTQQSPTMHILLQSTSEAIRCLSEFDTEAEIIVKDGESVVFVGRICSMAQSISGNVSIECEDSLAYLNDSIVRPYATYNFEDAPRIYASTAGELLEWFLQQHNLHIQDEARRVYLGRCFCSQLPIQAASTERPSTKGEISEKLCDRIGGFLVMRYENGQKLLDYIADAGECSQVVQYGVNLLAYDNQLDATEVYTAIIPTNAEIELTDSDADLVRSLTGYAYDSGAIVDELAQGIYGRIERTKEYDAETKRQLIYEAARDLSSACEAQTITVSALDLSMVEDAEPIRFLQLITVNNTLTGTQSKMLCTYAHIDLLEPYNNTYELGSVYDTMTGIAANAGTGGGNTDAAAINAAVNGAIQTHNASPNAHGLASWAKQPDKPTYTAAEISGLATVATSGSYNDLAGKPTIPPTVNDATVAGWGYLKTESDPVFAASPAAGITSANITAWNNKGTYTKPSGGIPKGDLASSVQTSLNRADTALQSYTETDPTVPSWAKAANKPTYAATEITGLATVATTGSYNDLTDKPTPAEGAAFFEGDYDGWHYRRCGDWLEMWQIKSVAFKAGNNWSDTSMPTALPFASNHFGVLAHAEDWRVQNIYTGSANDSDRPGRNLFKIGATNSSSSVINSLTFVHCFGQSAPSWALFPARTRSSGWYSSTLDELGNVRITGNATTTKVGSVVPLSAITGLPLPAGTYRLRVVGDETIKSVVSRNNPDTADCYHLSMYVAPDSSHTDPTQSLSFTIVEGVTPTQAEVDIIAGRGDTFTLSEDGTALIISIYPPTAYSWTGTAQYLIERVE